MTSPTVIGHTEEEDGLVEGCEDSTSSRALGPSRGGGGAPPGEGQELRAACSAFCGVAVICYALGAWAMVLVLSTVGSAPAVAPEESRSLPLVAAHERAQGNQPEPVASGNTGGASNVAQTTGASAPAGHAEPEGRMGPHTLEQHADAPVTIHHVRFPRAFQVCNKYLLRDMPRTRAPRIFCFTWVRPPEDDPKAGTEATLPELHELYAECDGYAIFSNFEDPSRGIVKAHDGPSGKNTQSSIQFHSVYTRLVHDAALASYDWFLDLEPDHFVRVRLLRRLLANFSSPSGGAVYLQQMTIRAFNRDFLLEAGRQWEKVAGRLESGCPVYTSKDLRGNCQGDVTMPLMGRAMANVTVLGVPMRGGAMGRYVDLQFLGKGWTEEATQIQRCCNFSHAQGDGFCP